jgi:hypothetical protein
MQPKALAVTQFAPTSAVRIRSLALQVPAMLIAAFLTAVLVAKLEVVSYAPGAVQPDAESVYETMIVSP